MNARVVARCVRRLLPGIVCGIYTPQEISDFNEGEIVDAAIPHLEHFPQEQSTQQGDIVSHPVAGPCHQDQLEQIRQLGNEVMAFDPDILNKVKALLQQQNKSQLAELSFDDARQLIISLQMKIDENHLGKSLAS